MKIVCWRIVFFAILIFQPENGAARPQGPVPPPPPVPNRAATDMWRGLAKRARKLIEEGGTLEQQGRMFEALALYQKAYALYPNHTVTNSAVGWTYHRLGRDREALPYLERALALDRTLLANFTSLYITYSTLGERERAAQVAEQGAAAFPNLDFAQGILGDALYWTGKYDEAIAAYTKAQSLRGVTVAAELSEDLGWCYVAKQDYTRAQQYLGNTPRLGIGLGSQPLTVLEIRKNGPADRAGLRMGDQLLELNGESLASVDAKLFAERIQKIPFGQTAHLKVLRAARLVEMDIVVGVTPDLGLQPNVTAPTAATSAAATSPANPTSPAPTASPSPPAATPAALTINRVEVKPSTVAPGERFTLEVSYTATAKSTVSFSYSIRSGQQKLFTSSRQMLEGGSPEAMVIKKTLTATKTPGNYTIEVQMSAEEAKAARETALTVVAKN